MRQQIMALPVVEIAGTPSNGKPADKVLGQLWDEAERIVATQRPPSPPARQTDSAEKTLRVSYMYD